MRKTFRSVSLLATLVLLFSSSVAFGRSDHVRWDIVSLSGQTHVNFLGRALW